MVDSIFQRKTNRLGSIDFFKILAMILVIWGHALQYGIDKVSSYPHPVGHFLASFHMPLFMFLSGIFAHSALKRSFSEMLWQKILLLLTPTIIWTSIEAILLSILNKTYFDNHTLLDNYISEYWFIKSLLGCYIIYFITMKVVKKNILAALVGIIITWSFPIFNEYNIASMLPFFYLGSIMRSWIINETKDNFPIFIVSFVLLIVLYHFWEFDYTFYASNYSLFSVSDYSRVSFNSYETIILLFRFIIGLVGTISFISLFKIIYYSIGNTKFGHILSDWGQDTLGIYMIHVMILVAMAKVFKFAADTNIYYYNYIYVFISVVLALVLSIVFIKIVLRMPKIFRILLVGKK